MRCAFFCRLQLLYSINRFWRKRQVLYKIHLKQTWLLYWTDIRAFKAELGLEASTVHSYNLTTEMCSVAFGMRHSNIRQSTTASCTECMIWPCRIVPWPRQLVAFLSHLRPELSLSGQSVRILWRQKPHFSCIFGYFGFALSI
jgi:hypothetical protein